MLDLQWKGAWLVRVDMCVNDKKQWKPLEYSFYSSSFGLTTFVFRDHLCIFLSRLVYGPAKLCVRKVHMEQPKANTESISPFEVVHQGPCKISTDVDPVLFYSYTKHREIKQREDHHHQPSITHEKIGHHTETMNPRPPKLIFHIHGNKRYTDCPEGGAKSDNFPFVQ